MKDEIRHPSSFILHPSSFLGKVHAHQELGVALGAIHAIGQQFHRLDRVHVAEHLVKDINPLQFVLGPQQFFLAGAGGAHVDGRPDALVDQLTVEVELHVAGALELLENHVVHPAAGVDEGGGQNRQGAALLDVSGGPEKALRLVQGGRVEAAGEQLAAGRRLGVVRPRQPGDREGSIAPVTAPTC